MKKQRLTPGAGARPLAPPEARPKGRLAPGSAGVHPSPRPGSGRQPASSAGAGALPPEPAIPAIWFPAGIVLWPLEKLRPYARNARTHTPDQVAKIAASMLEFGWTNPILVDPAAQEIVAGEGRLAAAHSLALAQAPVIELPHLTQAQKRAYRLADNRLALDAGWDLELLSGELRDLEKAGLDLGVIGFEDTELLKLLEPPSLEGEKEEAPPPSPPARPVSRLGDLWILNQHAVLCGDATDAAAVSRLMDGALADCVWTDPPYNVDYQGGVRPAGAGPIMNDRMPEVAFGVFLRTALRLMREHMLPGASIYMAHADTVGGLCRRSFERAGFVLSSCLIWEKNALVLGRSDYQWMHEPILYGWKAGSGHRWFGGRAETTIAAVPESPLAQIGDREWQISFGDRVFIIRGDNLTLEAVHGSVFHEPKPARNPDHPTMKPVRLIQRMLANSTQAGQLVLDSFGGSGSTLMACERLGLRARLLELEPKFTDVIVRRWTESTGQQARLEGDGRAFEEIAGERRASAGKPEGSERAPGSRAGRARASAGILEGSERAPGSRARRRG
jgi:DNA modification methylase